MESSKEGSGKVVGKFHPQNVGGPTGIREVVGGKMVHRRVVRRGRKTRGLTKGQKKQVKRLISGTQELKARDTFINAAPTAAGVIQLLNLPAQGLGVSERLADEIILKRLMFRLNVLGADATNIVRCIIFRSSQDNTIGANFPTPNSVLQNLSTMSLYNFTSDRDNDISVLYDRTITVSAGGTYDIAFRGNLFGKRLGRKKLIFDAAVLTGTGQIYILMISDSVAGPHPTVGGYMRIEYTDS